ncbi:uncharacterized protein RCO7_09155 [Rhynchosporium graminicola]|uniref:CNNM transmembrane domain-containing protein n=1 Tax=Rhynchosporium graminicola TaxID=2792576 RepID=A0A1E1L393_9HELO|nr:uncharacterized protein RCO7_09155 [Rhynchosporium commune]
MSPSHLQTLESVHHITTRQVNSIGDSFASRDFTYTVFFGGARIAMIVVSAILVIFAALLTGLTLAVCGLDMNYLHLRSVTGTPQERRQVREVLRIRRHTNWMLCSLIICSVACSQTFPFVIQSVWHGPQFWVPLLISTLTMTIFVELIPQYFIPQQAIAWGYYCWPVIWGCMWFTCIITFPVGWLLDKLQTKKDRIGIFTNDELQAVIQYHERSEKRGGKLGQDAARIMMGALKLDAQRLCGNMKKQEHQSVPDEQDIEKMGSAAEDGMIVEWSLVKTVDINETVDEAFVQKVRSWSYSRIPVTGKDPEDIREGENIHTEGWKGNKVFGFIHVKNLVGLPVTAPAKGQSSPKVKDLVLYPLPIVRADMMAIVVRESSFAGDGKTGSTLWTATERTNTHLMSNLKGAKGKYFWTMDYLKGAQAAATDQEHTRQNVLGIECPQPIGILTFEDVVDTILQKTSRDEKDFYDCNWSLPPTKSKKIGDYVSPLSPSAVDQDLPLLRKKSHVTFEKSVNPGTMRKRKVSNGVSGQCCPTGMDGAVDCSLNKHRASSIRLPKNQQHSTRSSYTDNSRGGFHGMDESVISTNHSIMMTPEEIVELANTSSSDCLGNPYSHVKASSLPTRRSDSAVSEDLKGNRIVSAGARLHHLRRVAPFPRENASSFERTPEKQSGVELTELTMPNPSMSPALFPSIDFHLNYNSKVSGIDTDEMKDSSPGELQTHNRQKSGETTSIMSWSSDDDAHQMVTSVYDAFPAAAIGSHEPCLLQKSLDVVLEEKEPSRPYSGFPPELLESIEKQKRRPDYGSKTLPRSLGTELNLEDFPERRINTTPPARQSSFHDDRAMLPSQRRILEVSSLGLGARSSSLWF